MRGSAKTDERVSEILAQIGRLATGDYGHHLTVSTRMDEVDSISAGLNKLADIFRVREQTGKNNEERTQQLTDLLHKYSQLNFHEKVPRDAKGDQGDPLATALMALREAVIIQIDKLKETESRIQTILKNASDAVVVIDEQHVIVQWNPAAKTMFGWDEKEVLGRYLHEILTPDHYRKEYLSGIENYLRTGEGGLVNRTIELPALRKDKSEIQIELTLSPAKLNDRYFLTAFIRDVTRRKEAEEEYRLLNATLEQRVLDRAGELNASEKKYRQLFEDNPMPLWVLDAETLRFLDVNESAIKHYGFTREEFLSMSSVDLRPEDEVSRYINLNRSIRGTQNTGVWKHRKKDGSIIYCEVTVHEILFEGRPGRLVLCNDVTEKRAAIKALQFSETRFRSIFDSKITGFFFWNENGQITAANDLFLEMVGYSRIDLENGIMHLNGMTPPEYSEAEMQALKQIRNDGACEPFEKEYFRKDGSRVAVMIGAANIHDGESITGVTCVTDISYRKKMENEILELNRDLEQRITQRTKALQDANKELESFSYSVSHDLRTPLRAIHGYSQMLFEEYGKKLDDEGIRLIREVTFNAKRMGQLVDDLLAFSRMGKRALNRTDVNLNGLVLDILRELRIEEHKRLSITVQPLGVVQGDEILIRQAYQNLISNAVKYSSQRQDPKIEIGLTQIDGTAVYYVKDNGVGFDMAYYKKLFGVFQRLHGQEEFEGTGVGLAIVLRIIERHGGTIWANSRVGHGATFYFTLQPGSLSRKNGGRIHPELPLPEEMNE